MALGQRQIGTTLQKTSNTPLTLAGLTKITAIGVTSKEISTTSLDSPNNFAESIAGLMDAGTINLEGIVKDTTTMSTMYALATAQTVEAWIITLPGGQKWFASGYVASWMENDITTDGVRSYKGSLRITGQVKFAENGISS